MKGDKALFRERMLERYWQVTAEDLPAIADERGWPVSEVQEFQRIILDTICKGVWYDRIAEPAARHMSNGQLRKAVYLAEDILAGRTSLESLNEQSLLWREARTKYLYNH